MVVQTADDKVVEMLNQCGAVWCSREGAYKIFLNPTAASYLHNQSKRARLRVAFERLGARVRWIM